MPNAQEAGCLHAHYPQADVNLVYYPGQKPLLGAMWPVVSGPGASVVFPVLCLQNLKEDPIELSADRTQK